MPVDQANQVAERNAVARLRRSMRTCAEKIKAFRDDRVYAMEQYVGSHYGKSRAATLPMNVLAGAVLSIVPNIISGRPRASCRGRTPDASMLADLLAVDLNDWAARSRFEDRFRVLVLDGMFGPALLWTGLSPGEESSGRNFEGDVGEVETARVSLDDYWLDPNAKEREAALYEGHTREVAYRYVMDNPDFQNKANLSVGEVPSDGSQARDLSGKRDSMAGDLIDMLRLPELFLPQGFDGRDAPLLVTLPPLGQGDFPLRVVDYKGPKQGPYDDLTFHWVPDQALGLAPVAVYLDLHEKINAYARKLFRRLDREKVLGIIEEAAKADGITIKHADDGDLVFVKDRDRIGELHLGGPAGDQTGMLSALLQFFSRQAGNLDLIAGLDNAAPTLGQEEMLAGNASVRLFDMRREAMRTAANVFRRVAWYRYHDPRHAPTLKRNVPGVDFPIESDWTPEVRAQANIDDYDIKTEATSWRPDPPEVLVKKVVEFANLGLQYEARLATQGVAVNAEAVMRRVANLQGIDEVDELLETASPEELVPAAAPGKPQFPTPQSRSRGRITINTQPRPPQPTTAGGPPRATTRPTNRPKPQTGSLARGP